MDTSPLAGWDNFYVIVGSSAAGLTGLTFVVIALIRDVARTQPLGLRAFVTPTIVHFSAVLAVAAFMSMPHQHVWSLSAGFALTGLAGLIYAALITASIPAVKSDYVPVWEDWIFNVILPTVVYGGFAVAAALIWFWPVAALYEVGGLVLILLFVGIHNAWDIAVWMTLQKPRGPGG